MPVLVCLSANHRATPFDALERLSSVGEDLRAGVPLAHESIGGAVVLATCNRFEAYLDVDVQDDVSPESAVDAALSEISRTSGIGFRELHDSIDVTVGNRVAHHLFAVASGLESVVVGEDEIAGQVRRAYDDARSSGMTTRSLEHLFDRASETSRAVKNSTQLGESGRSLVRLALELASSRITDWTAARVLLVGTGRYAAAALASLRVRGAGDIRVLSGSGRGATFAARHGLVAVDPTAADGDLAQADVIVTCTTREALDAARLSAARERSAAATDHVLIIDLGMPRNVAPDVQNLAGVELLDLDTIRIHAPIDEIASLADARALVSAAATRHASVRRVHDVAPAVLAARGWVQQLLDAEITRLPTRDGAPAPETERALRHFAGVIMHHLVARGHTLAASGEGDRWSRAIDTVFPSSDAAAAAPSSPAADTRPPTADCA